jgi:hypothetical protein
VFVTNLDEAGGPCRIVVTPSAALGWKPLPTLRSYETAVHRAWVREQGRGNIELGLELTSEVEATRKRLGSTEILPEEIRKGSPRMGASPTGRPYAPSGFEPTVESESLRDVRTGVERNRPLARAVPIPYMPGVPLHMRPSTVQPPVPRPGEPRREARTVLIPREARDALRRYLARLQTNPSAYTQRNIVVAAAYALYTSRIGAVPFGAIVTPRVGRPGFDFTPASEVPGQGIRASAMVPGELPPEFGTTLPYRAETPVFYESILAVIFSTLGSANIYNTNVSNILQEAGWRREGFLSGSRIETLRPPQLVPKGPPKYAGFGTPEKLLPFPQYERGQRGPTPGQKHLS